MLITNTALLYKIKMRRIKRSLLRILHFNRSAVLKMAPAEYRYFFASQQVYLVILLAHVLFLVIFTYLKIPALAFFNLFSIFAYIACLLMNQKDAYLGAAIITLVEVNLHALLAVTSLGWSSGFYYYLLAIGPVAMMHNKLGIHIKLLFVVTVVFMFSYLYFTRNDYLPVYELDEIVLERLYILNAAGLYFILSFFSFLYSWAANRSDQRMQAVGEKWEQLASVDALTGLPNRRAMEEILNQEISRILRGTQPFALVIVDIDDFKLINDQYGHSFGDVVLKSAAMLMREEIRKHDIVSRWGGEEFLILLPECTESGAYDALQKLRRKIAATTVSLGDSEANITVTMGVCLFQPGDSLQDCLNTADTALYEGKYSGKNKVVISYNRMLSFKL